MTNHRYFAAPLLVVLLAFLTSSAIAQKNSKYACAEANPQSLCNAGNTCGSESSPCDVNVKRTAYAASSTPQIPGAKGNGLFCLRPGTKVNWKSDSKNTGFVVDLGPQSPFEPAGAIIGGSDKAVTVVAQRSGCFKYSTGACVSGALSGMCGNSTAELIVTGK